MVGEPDALIAAIRQAERAGLREISLLPPLKTSREVYKDFAEQVIAKILKVGRKVPIVLTEKY